MISEPRGLALILSNVHFNCEKDLEYRSGGDVDCTSLELLFKNLGYQVTVFHDQSAEVRGILVLSSTDVLVVLVQMAEFVAVT